MRVDLVVPTDRLGAIVDTTDRLLGKGSFGLDGAFEMIISSKKGAVGAGDLVHFSGASYRRGDRPQNTPSSEKNKPPSADKTQWY